MLRPGAPKHLKTWWGQSIKSMKLRGKSFGSNKKLKVGKENPGKTKWRHIP